MNTTELDALFICSTDRYLNEYVPQEASFRQWISGFTGSAGDALITKNKAYLAVDSRYWLQAEQELEAKFWTLIKVPFGDTIWQTLIRTAFATELAEADLQIGYAAESMVPQRLQQFESALPHASWVPMVPAPASRIHPPLAQNKPPQIFAVDEDLLGSSVQNKLQLISPILLEAEADALLIQRLDELMWVANLRGKEFPNQASFGGIGLATSEKLYIGTSFDSVPDSIKEQRPSIVFLEEEKLWDLIKTKSGPKTIAFDPANNTLLARDLIKKAGGSLVEVFAPLQPIRARKTEGEIEAMSFAFHRADVVVDTSLKWAKQLVSKGKRVTEASLSAEVSKRFTEAGAIGHSFATICAAGRNGAFIHYGPPSARKALREGELVLLDTGAYFEEGYATDLTRTAFIGEDNPSEEQKRIYTLVLRASIAGMTAILPTGARGYQLDALIRSPLWAAGLDFSHGTGHGVGINVHEFPPRVGPSSQSILEIGHIFSIEPGYYHPKFGGVRIENLCTLVEGPPGFMQVEPLTFAPFEKKLIDTAQLSAKEKAFLKRYREEFKERKQLLDA